MYHEKENRNFCRRLMLVALSAVAFFAKSQNTETSLLMRNVEALARGEDGEEGEDGGQKKGYSLVVDFKNGCTITYKGNTEPGFYAWCHSNSGDLLSCASGCLRSADLH